MKKVLIVGEYSSLGSNIKKGLSENSIDTYIVTDGDGWKKIKNIDDKVININNKNFKILGKTIKGSGKICYLFEYFFKVKPILKKHRFDIILIMNQSFISNNFIPNRYNNYYLHLKFLKKILNKHGKIYMLACGDDSYYFQAQSIYKYFPYSEIEIKKSVFMRFNAIKKYEKILDKIDGIIPTCWDYTEAYRLFYKNNTKLKQTIQFPIDLSNVNYKKNVIKDKIIIFHGLNREGFKGTKYIREAMENIKRKYPDKVEIVIDGRMPLEEYKKILEKSNIVIDQCKSYSYGMNALISMAQGKLVFSGNEEECMNELKRNDIPVVNITPSVEDIEEKLEYFIKNSHLITEIGEKSRKFIEEFHECSVVAKKYLEIMGD